MAKAKVKVEKFDKVNKSKITVSDRLNKTRTGQSKAGKVKAHGKMKMGK